MQFVADLHIHSKYARACSPMLTLENIDAWCRIKGVDIVSCADFTHPKWFEELRKKLRPSEHDGLYLLDFNDQARSAQGASGLTLPPPIPLPHKPTLFMIGTEVACIYSDRNIFETESPSFGPDGHRGLQSASRLGLKPRASGSKVRRVHHCIYAPSLELAEKINKAIEARGDKLGSDGRPILGISSKDLLKLLLDIDERCVLAPAHSWTPWFAVFGSFSGYDSVQECFGDLTKHIFAIETGLSADPPMAWRQSELDNYALISNSDAHSLPNLGREANIFEGDQKDVSYKAIWQAVRNAAPARFLELRIKNQELNPHLNPPPVNRGRNEEGVRMIGTIEFIPDEGRYHYDGHRACGVRLHPHETKKLGGICPRCKKKVTVGVLSRVEALADLPHERKPDQTPKFWSLVEFDKLIAEALGVTSRKSKAVERQYWELVKAGGTELNILMNFDKQKLAGFCPPIIVEAIVRMREGKIEVEPGYDGEYGIIKIFTDKERKKLEQAKLF